MKIKALEKFFDLELKVLHEAGEVFEVSEERGAALTSKNNKTKRILCTAVSEGEQIAALEEEPEAEEVAVMEVEAEKVAVSDGEPEAEEVAALEEEPGEEKAEVLKEKPKRKKAVKNEKAE